MLRAQIPKDETQRLAAVNSLGLLHTAPEERFERITSLARRMFDVPVAMISLISADRQWCKSVQGVGMREFPRDISFCAHTILRDKPTVIADARAHWGFADNPLVEGEPRIRFYAGCPLRFEGYPVGSLCIISHEAREFSDDHLESLRSLADIAENEFSFEVLNDAQDRLLEQLDDSRRRELLDALTNIWNRRGIEELLPRELSRANRNGEEVAVMLIDVDAYFQSIGLRGKDTADAVIREVARRLRGCVRPHDVLGRYDEDDFLVFLGRCDRSNSRMIAERMINAISKVPIATNSGDLAVSLSIGIYSMQDVDGRSMGQIVEAAGQALLTARENGGDQVAHY